MPERSELAAFMLRHGLSPQMVAAVAGVSIKTANAWLKPGGKTCPEPAWRLLLVVYGEARAEEYKKLGAAT